LEAQKRKWKEYLEQSSLVPNLERLYILNILRLYDVLSRKEMCQVLLGIKFRLRTRLLSVLPERVRKLYDEELDFLRKQEKEDFLSYEDLLRSLKALNEYIRKHYCSLAERSKNLRPGSEGGLHSQLILKDDRAEEKPEEKKKEEANLNKMTRRRAKKLLNKCHFDLHYYDQIVLGDPPYYQTKDVEHVIYAA